MEQLEYIKPSRLIRQKRRDKRLAEELIECRRGNGGDKNKKLREKGEVKRNQIDFKSRTPRFRSSIIDKRNDTYFDDNLEPLIRFLQSNCGKPWDEVYSKLSKQLDKRSTQGMHVLEHLWDFVSTNVKIEHGELVFFSRHGKPIPFRRSKYFNRFYIHPTTGILIDNYNKKQVGPFPKKARWKMERDKKKWKQRAGVPFKKKKSFLFKEVNTSRHRLVENQVYDVRIERLSGEKKVGFFRVKLNRIIKSNKELSLKVSILKSNDHITGHCVILEKDNVRSDRERAYQAREKFKWTIYEPGHFFFEPRKHREINHYR